MELHALEEMAEMTSAMDVPLETPVFPRVTPPAMAYVPYQQWGDVYDAVSVSAQYLKFEDRLCLASWIAMLYAKTTFPDDFKHSVERKRKAAQRYGNKQYLHAVFYCRYLLLCFGKSCCICTLQLMQCS